MKRAAILLGVALAGVSCPAVADASSCLDAADEARSLFAEHRLLEARSRLLVCAASECEPDVRTLCAERLGEIASRLPTIIVDARDAAGNDLSDVTIAIDGVVHANALAREIALDPGVHVFVFESPKAGRVERRLVLVEREKARRERVTFEGDAIPRTDVASSTARGASDAARASGASTGWRTTGWIGIAAGAVAVGIGAAFGVHAIAKENDAGCDRTNVCDDPRSRSDARAAADVATIGISVGAVLALGGLALVLFASPTRTVAPPSASGRAATTSFDLRW